MNGFEYMSPTSVKQAIALLAPAWGESEIIAGGTDLLGRIKDYVSTPKRVVNIKNIAGLQSLNKEAGGLRIGALVTLDRIVESTEVRQEFPALARTVAEAASPQIRNMATIGGNLCQRPRCWYFRNGMGLMAKGPEGKSLVVEGDNRFHAILGNEGPAYFVTPSTIAPMLIAYNSRIRIVGPDGAREIELQKFFRIPQSDDEREHDLRPNEIVTDILIPPAKQVRAANYEVRQKTAFDWPLATASVVLEMGENRVQKARVILGAVSPTPWLSEEAAQAVVGKSIDQQTANAAGAAAVAKARPLSQNAYKIKLAAVAVKRALLLATDQPIPDVHSQQSRGAA
ncbi:MAG: FAD binding domain-containing protein [Acidobacteria bacterium]|nr:FAD binding domain-containing protein [Acidobacteriota bacterium]